MRVFAGILTVGQLAGALAAIGVACLGIWRYIIQPARKVAKVYKSIGDNGQETVFELLHEVRDDMKAMKTWRVTVDETLAYHSRTLHQQNLTLQAQDVALDRLLEQSDRH